MSEKWPLLFRLIEIFWRAGPTPAERPACTAPLGGFSGFEGSFLDSIKVHPAFKVLLVAVLLGVLYVSRFVVIASIIGVGIGVLFSPLLDFLQKWLRLRRGYGALVLILGVLIFVAVVLGFFGFVIVDQAKTLIERLPEIYAALQASLGRIFKLFPWVLEQVKQFDFASTLQAMAKYLVTGAQVGSIAIGGVIFAFILGVYLAVDADYYFKGTVRAFLPRHRDRARHVLVESARVVRVWFRAQLIDMAIIGAITTLGLWIVGVQYWALFGLLTAILGIIPYVGVMIVVVVVSAITLATDASLVPWVFLVFFVTQQIEGNVVLPLVMKGQAEIPEALLLVVMLLFGFWFGLLGVFIAPPVVAVVICLYRELYLPALEGARTR